MEKQNREKKFILTIILQQEIDLIKFPIELSNLMYIKIIERINSG